MDKTEQEILDQYTGKITAVLLNTERLRRAVRITAAASGVPKGRYFKGDKGVYQFDWAPTGTETRNNQEFGTERYREAAQGGFNAKELTQRAKAMTPYVLAGPLEVPVEELRREHIVQVADMAPDL